MAGESILVVEDEEANLRLFTYLLSAKGYQVRGAADAQEAMELLGEFHSRIDLDGSAAPRHERVRHQDPYPGWVHGNTTVIIGEREVFVVDSTQFPSAAREDIAQIKQWTDKPVAISSIPIGTPITSAGTGNTSLHIHRSRSSPTAIPSRWQTISGARSPG